MTVQFTIPGRLKGKGRPRFARAGAFVRTFTDAKTLSGEALVRQYAALAMNGTKPLEGPLVLDVTLCLNRPTSWSKRKRAETYHATGKPDLDNVVKLVGDALNGIVFGDDSQLCEVRIRRVYDDETGENAMIRVAAA